MDKNDARELLEKYRLGILSEEETAILESWYIQQARNTQGLNLSEEELKEDLLRLEQKVLAPVVELKGNSNRPYLKYSLLAAAVAGLFLAFSLVFNQKADIKEIVGNEQLSVLNDSNAVLDRKKAILTLGDSRQIVLDNNGKNISNQGELEIHQTTDGKIAFKSLSQDLIVGKEIQYNTISTPIGAEYEIELIDGTKVWLNSMSSIRFPNRFQGNVREVYVTGEVYFDVKSDKRKPFHVLTEGQRIEVLGTEFNVNAYERDVKTTLFEGSVKVAVQGSQNYSILKPGDQSVLSTAQRNFSVQRVDLEQALGWKNGYFIFNNDDLAFVMQQIERWYDVEISYATAIKQIKLGGAIARNRDLDEVLNLLELSANIKFKRTGRRIVVTR